MLASGFTSFIATNNGRYCDPADLHQDTEATDLILFNNPSAANRSFWPFGQNHIASDGDAKRVFNYSMQEAKMANVALNNPHGNDFDKFLFADVGEDRNGNAVSVLSTLARLGLDPWEEALALGSLRRDAVRLRLDELLSTFKDVPTLDFEHRAVAAKLALLLP